MRQNIPDELLKKYLNGNCTPAEKTLVDVWFASFEPADDFISDLPAYEQDLIKNNLLNKIKENIRATESNSLPPKEAPVIPFPVNQNSKSLFFYAAKIAAILIFAFGLGFLGFKFFTIPQTAHTIAGPTIFNNQVKLVKKIMLADGSSVWLQENSTLTVSGAFNSSQRKVSLVGEAFFEVSKDKTRPFIIESGGVTTRVLGTSFNIKAYAKEPTVEINVVTGKVSVYPNAPLKAEVKTLGIALDEKAAVVLKPKQKITFVKNDQSLIKKEVSPAGRQMVWAKSSLSFENTPIRQVVQMLNQEFNTTIKLANPDLNNCSIYGDFTNQNLPEILEVICKSIEAEYQLFKSEVIITGEGCAANNILP